MVDLIVIESRNSISMHGKPQGTIYIYIYMHMIIENIIGVRFDVDHYAYVDLSQQHMSTEY